MRLILRIVLLLATLRFAVQALIGYAFDFRAHGYPVWPLFIVGLSFAGYVRLRPKHYPLPEILGDSQHRHTRESFLLLILAILTSAFLLHYRGAAPLLPVYFQHLCTLTLFQLMVPFILAYAFNFRARALVTMTATLVLMAVMVNGTFANAEPVVQYFREAQGYAPGCPLPDSYVLPEEILPPPPAVPGPRFRAHP